MTIRDLTCKLYHVDLGIPPSLLAQAPQPNLRLRYSTHARTRFATKARPTQPVSLPSVLPAGFQVIEAEEFLGQVRKWVVRFRWMDGRDLVLALGSDGFVWTLWTHHRDDHHATLRKEHYHVTKRA
jgi:hypothetical protein